MSSLKEQTRNLLEMAFKDSVTPGCNNHGAFFYGMQGISDSFSERGNQDGQAMDQDDALDLYAEFSVMPDLVLDARGDEGLPLALMMEKRIREIGQQHFFDQNTLEI